MTPRMAEKFVVFGYEDHGVKICLAPDVQLTLFADGSALYESHRRQIVYPDCWDRCGDKAFTGETLCN